MRVLPINGSSYHAEMNNLKSNKQGNQQSSAATVPCTPSFKQGAGSAVVVLCGSVLSSAAILMGATAIAFLAVSVA